MSPKITILENLEATARININDQECFRAKLSPPPIHPLRLYFRASVDNFSQFVMVALLIKTVILIKTLFFLPK